MIKIYFGLYILKIKNFRIQSDHFLLSKKNIRTELKMRVEQEINATEMIEMFLRQISYKKKTKTNTTTLDYI